MSAPANGIWRIGRGDDPLRPQQVPPIDLGETRAGNRFDSFMGNYGVLYFGTTLEVCFGETLNRFRRDPALAFIDEEWERLRFMRPGHVPTDWRSRRTAVKVYPATGSVFLDVEDVNTREWLGDELRLMLGMLSYGPEIGLDVGLVRGHDRRVTRLMSQAAWDQRSPEGGHVFAGIRYLSRTNDEWECWAIYDHVGIVEVERQPILLNTEGLERVASLYSLRVF